MLTINALVAANSVLIPCQAQHLSTAGLVELLKTINEARQQINPALEIEGVLMTMYDGRTNMSRNTAQAIREAYAEHIRIFDSMIPIAFARYRL
jgi:chromosome partitioning protein